jgi:outer membrane protein assembly factor BamB
MKRFLAIGLIAVLSLSLSSSASDWPQWRGPHADGVSPDTGFPTEWDGKKGTNVRWKVPLPGAGNSCPVVMGRDLLITATSGREHSELHVLCLDLETGKQRWRTDLTATPADAPFTMFPPERGHAACTPVVTEKAVFSLFGTGDLVCLDRSGKPLWMRSLTKEYGIIRNDYGIAASLVVADGLVLVQVDHLEGSYLLAADAVTGKTVWKTPRPGIYDNWSTPVVTNVGGKKQVVCLGTKTVIGYELATGKQAWTVAGLERLCSPTPIVCGNKLYAVSGTGGATLALDLKATPEPKVLWRSKKNGPLVPSAIVVGDLYFMTDDQGTATCLDLKTGTEKWRERLGTGRMRPSPVAADGNIYFTGLDGTTVVVKAADEFELLAKNPLGEEVAASLALSGGRIFIRGGQHLWCIGK